MGFPGEPSATACPAVARPVSRSMETLDLRCVMALAYRGYRHEQKKDGQKA